MRRPIVFAASSMLLLAASLTSQNPTPTPPAPKPGSLGHPEHQAELGRICDVIAVAERFLAWCKATNKKYDTGLGGEPMAPDIQREIDALKAQKKNVLVDPPPPAVADGWTSPESDKEREEDQTAGLGKYRHWGQGAGGGTETTRLAPYLLDGQPDHNTIVTLETSQAFANVRLAEITLHEMGRQTQTLCTHAECRKIQNDKKTEHDKYPGTPIGDKAVSEDKDTYKNNAKVYDRDLAFYRFIATPAESTTQGLTVADKKALGKFFGGLRTLKENSITRMKSACLEATAREQ